MKTKEELILLKIEYETLSNKLKELSNDELKQVTDGTITWNISAKLKESIQSISEENINMVTGGSNIITKMECLNCHYSIDWLGDYIGKVFDCPSCHYHTFTSARNDVKDDDKPIRKK